MDAPVTSVTASSRQDWSSTACTIHQVTSLSSTTLDVGKCGVDRHSSSDDVYTAFAGFVDCRSSTSTTLYSSTREARRKHAPPARLPAELVLVLGFCSVAPHPCDTGPMGCTPWMASAQD